MWTPLAVALAVVSAALALLVGWGVAELGRQRRLHRRTVGERGWLLERERRSAAEVAVAAERARIARELHDIVSHHVSIMVVQTSAAHDALMATSPATRAGLPVGTLEALGTVADAGRQAMTELRHLLGLLAPRADGADGSSDGGSGGDDADRNGVPHPPEPQPGMDRLGALVDRFAFAGLPVEVRVSGTPRVLPAGIGLAAYRIVQEALTNALKHCDGGCAEVTVRYSDRSLRVEVLTTGPSVLTAPRADPAGRDTAGDGTSDAPIRTPTLEGAGRGLLGLRQRVAVYGGDLDARRRLGGGYRVRARIPLDPP